MDDTIIGKNNNGFEESDYYFDMAKDNDGNLVIDVRENHSTQNMKDAGADPSSTPRIGTFRINGKGYLQVQSDDGLHYRTVATVYGQ
ncbi:hypothetical protein [Secundilactobacillus odoratitofui]|nr:hypothetical protein [Secundilactobacillus odoratitofui]